MQVQDFQQVVELFRESAEEVALPSEVPGGADLVGFIADLGRAKFPGFLPGRVQLIHRHLAHHPDKLFRPVTGRVAIAGHQRVLDFVVGLQRDLTSFCWAIRSRPSRNNMDISNTQGFRDRWVSGFDGFDVESGVKYAPDDFRFGDAFGMHNQSSVGAGGVDGPVADSQAPGLGQD